jgi:hypothetical protein
MLKKTGKALLGALLTTLLVVALTACKRQSNGAATGDDIHPPDLVDLDKTVPTPEVIFPQELKTDDPTVNEFIHSALEACQKGSYDRFSELFGVTVEVPEAPQFGKVWRGVKSIRVAGTYKNPSKDPEQPAEYYVHVVVQLRQPDRYERTERQAVLWVFRERDQWRMAPASSEIQGRLLYANTQPADGSTPATRPSRRHATSRPAVSTTVPAS